MFQNLTQIFKNKFFNNCKCRRMEVPCFKTTISTALLIGITAKYKVDFFA